MQLSGHSGCELYLTPEGNVRKVSSSVQYNSRLIEQANKQELFKSSLGISSPKVLSVSTKSELHYFDMEYIGAETFSKYLVNEDFSEVKIEFTRILSFIKESINDSNYFDVTERIYNKTKTLNINFDINATSFLRKIECAQLLAPKGYCHGDLTFENILVSQQMYFIDFLDSFIDTPLIDLAKLSQEFNVYWSFRNCVTVEGLVFSKMHALSNIFLQLIDGLNYEYKRTFLYLQVLNLMRILPYTSDVRTYMLLKNSINKLNQFL